MRCQQVESKLSAFHDRELGRSESEAVREHLLNCQNCRDAAAEFRSISRWLEPPAAVPAVSDDFTDRVFDKIHQNETAGAATLFVTRFRAMKFVAIAAGVILSIGAIYLAAPRSSADGTLDAASEREVEERIHAMRALDPSSAVVTPNAARRTDANRSSRPAAPQNR